MAGANGIRFMGVMKGSRNAQGQVIDMWGRPLQITRLGEPHIEIRSAGRDGRPGTDDDLVEVWPRGQQE